MADRVMLRVLSKDREYAMQTDLVFIEDRPFAILEIVPEDRRQGLKVRVELEPQRLQEVRGRPGSWVYDGQIEDPRPLQ